MMTVRNPLQCTVLEGKERNKRKTYTFIYIVISVQYNYTLLKNIKLVKSPALKS